MSIAGDREIKALWVKCNNDVRCCSWKRTVGTLQDHVAKCNFTLLPCPNGCKNVYILKKDLPAHLSDLCEEREYQCQDCGLKDKYRVITGPYEDKCEKKMVSCMNKGCDSIVERRFVQAHVRLLCNNTEVSCEYASIGCGEKRIRLEMKAHEEDDKHHLPLTLSQITKLTKRMFWLENQLLLSEGGLRLTFIVSEYSYKKINKCIHSSEPFFTSITGYKMCLLVYASGNGDGEGSHLSVFLRILRGPHDDQLDWPLKGTFIIDLLNQLDDNNHHRTTVNYPGDGEHGRSGGNGWGFHTFIKLSELDFNSSKNTQYLKDDKLYIKVTPNMASSCKPWLNYTHK